MGRGQSIRGIKSRCLSSQLQCQNVRNATSQSMLQRKCLQVDIGGTRVVSNVECATRCWTARTTMRRTMNYFADLVMVEDMVQRVMDSVVELDASTWTLEKNLEIPNSQATSLMILLFWPNRYLLSICHLL